MKGAPLGPATWVDADGTAHHEGRAFPILVEGLFELVQRYVSGAPLLETVVASDVGVTGVTDLVWGGELVRVVTPYSGAARVRVEGVAPDAGRREAALRHWWQRRPEAPGPVREVAALSVALAELCGAEPGLLRPADEADVLGLFRTPAGDVDLGAHAALAAALGAR